ncbi:TetR family transcriptional regulator [Prauserella sp. PE36]|uniref:TetR/AcrR family transcriptional regulator n=1 Tax=Prauserella endophytica TaxID=1592324 RepID=A0ABY2S123_9PSEU|nr:MULTISPECIES: TetR/AcrR family transcriptional regulator [Prauserella]PXY37041.1 TetR family transcriptional regulator [Prauserella coralliicola]RBM10293.1 TetR family transcriptional regulator [Prauserella sp. PE36]TKG68394.1 TetR/AcrR family transcriptional regulator [Prauserella endophytica]
MPPKQLRARKQPTARQRALLGELEELFLAEGFVEFTLDDLAARLRCSKSTLYTLAASKEQLAVKVVAHFFKGAADRIEQRIDGIDDARKIIEVYLAGVADELKRASDRFMADVAAFEPARATYRMNSQAAAARIRSFIAKGVADGVFREVHATLVAELASLLVEGIQTGVVRARTGVSDAEAFTALAELLLGGIQRRVG